MTTKTFILKRPIKTSNEPDIEDITLEDPTVSMIMKANKAGGKMDSENDVYNYGVELISLVTKLSRNKIESLVESDFSEMLYFLGSLKYTAPEKKTEV